MKMSRAVVALAAPLAAIVGMFALGAPAYADVTAAQAFAADSGDSCRYGVTEGTLTWRLLPSPTPPAAATAVDVRGKLADRPLPADPGAICRDDGFYSVATFTAYSGTTVVGSQARRVDNGVVSFQFVLGGSSTVSRIDRLVIQVCRHPLVTLPPSYCGRAVEYRPAA